MAQTEPVTEVAKALGDDIRMEIVKMLAKKELCANDILSAFSISQPTLSYHMRLLTSSGVVKARRSGQWTYYSLCPDGFSTLEAFSKRMRTVAKKPGQAHTESAKKKRRAARPDVVAGEAEARQEQTEEPGAVRRDMESYLL